MNDGLTQWMRIAREAGVPFAFPTATFELARALLQRLSNGYALDKRSRRVLLALMIHKPDLIAAASTVCDLNTTEKAGAKAALKLLEAAQAVRLAEGMGGQFRRLHGLYLTPDCIARRCDYGPDLERWNARQPLTGQDVRRALKALGLPSRRRLR